MLGISIQRDRLHTELCWDPRLHEWSKKPRIKLYVSHLSLQGTLGYLLTFLGFCVTQKALWQPSILHNHPFCLDLEGASVARDYLLNHTAATFMILAMPTFKCLPGVSMGTHDSPSKKGWGGSLDPHLRSSHSFPPFVCNFS